MSAGAGARAHADAAEEDCVASLPAPLVQNIFSRLAADERARCATVRRSWRAAVSDSSLWTRLDLSVTSGVTCTLNDAALVAVTARAGGSLEMLDLRGRNAFGFPEYSHAALLAVATANSATLLELRGTDEQGRFRLEALLGAAPRLHVLEAYVYVSAADAGPMLRNEPPFGPLRLSKLSVRLMDELNDDGACAGSRRGCAPHAAHFAGTGRRTV
jgi:hypothetical protein